MSTNDTFEGTIPFDVPSTAAPAPTWFKVIGDLKSGSCPLIILHGGPGTGHENSLPLGKLWQLYGIPVIFYDQIGCGKSAHFPEKIYDEAFWHPDLFVAELNNLVKHFQLNRSDGPGYDVCGHSWGAILGNYFASKKPAGLRRLILGSGSTSGANFCKSVWKRVEEMSPEAKSTVEKAVAKDDFTSPEYLAVLQDLYTNYLCRYKPWPHPLLVPTFENLKQDSTVRLTYQGSKGIFVYDGFLRKWSSLQHLHKIAVPTLVVAGEFDTCIEDEYMAYFEHIPNARRVLISKASHMYWLDSDELEAKTLKLFGDFLQSAFVPDEKKRS